MSRELTIIYSADNPQQAHLLRSLLADEGIQAWVVNDAIQMAGGDLPLGWRSAAKVVVSDDQAAAAREFAEAFDCQAKHQFLESDEDEEAIETEEPLAASPSWPVCPACGEQRSARCPICGESGTDFPPADVPSAGESGQPLLLCRSCDDLISPGWYRLCARCGHDYGEGLQVEEPAIARLELSPRTVVVLTVLFLMVAAIGGYFFWPFAGRHP